MFMRELYCGLKLNCDIDSSDLMVSFINNTLADWSLGHGVAQYITGDLSCARHKANIAERGQQADPTVSNNYFSCVDAVMIIKLNQTFVVARDSILPPHRE